MVVLTSPTLDHLSLVAVHRTHHRPAAQIPTIDMSKSESKAAVVRACEEFGFFKVVNHGVPLGLMANLEAEAVRFFLSPQGEKDTAGPAEPFGYGCKRIGPNGDMGWVEYLLMPATPTPLRHFLRRNTSLRFSVEEYTAAMREVASEILEMLAEGLRLHAKDVFSRMVRDEGSDSVFRVNHYPPRPLWVEGDCSLTGFGEHTDPQILSVLRSNNTSGLQISLADGTWLAVPPDPTSLFVIVGDSLQVLTNGRFRSVKHRVITNSVKSRLSMIFFGGPPLSERISPVPALLEEGEESHYKDFTWSEYKSAAYRSKLSDNRLALFEK